ncbi:YnfA family protein [Vitreoscilla stercoraria]|uniref:YnfA family protein n=1 Tax=Vitreoscilla stercoraria TaxID=61 RepID=A0ABY4EAT4_VITST|nr:YnfA family protein [Vitreoscilla stercoraria]UOO92406.1 YnfA family protein [Vitreoscilla stercoraria]
MLKTLALFFLTALMEILGCFLPYIWLRQNGSVWLLVLGAAALCAFVYLLSLHPTASGRVYAAYGGVYVISALLWLQWVDKIALQWNDWLGAGVILTGVLLIVVPWQN